MPVDVASDKPSLPTEPLRPKFDPIRPELAIKLELVQLDVLEILGAAVADDIEEQSTSSQVAVAAPVLPPANMIVTSASAGPNGVVADDVGVRVAAEHRIDLARRIRRAEATGKAGEIVAVELEDDTTEHLLVLGLGDGSTDAARQAGAQLAERIRGTEIVLCGATASLSQAALRAFCEGLLLASYRFSRKSDRAPIKPVIVQLVVASVSRAAPTLVAAQATAEAVVLARDLGNRPSNEKNPVWLAEQAAALGRQAGLRVRVIDEAGLERGGFGGILAVGKGSANPPRLVVLEYHGDVGAPRVVLVGKGITFDSGGLSIKPAEGMPLMKTDMSGAAAVLAAMCSLRALNVRANVVGVLACAENMPSGDAYRPGDVVRHYGGRTSEVFNTDAEGRMVLADALAYAAARLRPDVLVDIATLTGAATVGLSRSYGALYTGDDGLAKALESAGRDSNDSLWRMPLVNEYRSSLDSSIADLSHVSRVAEGGGSITAALFLQEFTGGKRWAHLDIAGPARAERASYELTRGATGFGTRLLLRWLESAPNLW